MKTKLTIFGIAILITMAVSSCATWHRDIRDVRLDDVYVDIGKPRHWTLEDAHYLLASLQERMYDLEINEPSDLDPNAVNSIQLQSTQTVTDLAVKYDEIAAIQNRNNLANYQDAQNQIEEIKTRINVDTAKADQLRDDMYATQLSKAEKDLEVSKKQLEINSVNRAIAALQIRLDAIPTPAEGQSLSDEEMELKEELEAEIKDQQKIAAEKEDELLELTEESNKLQTDYDLVKAEYDFLSERISTDTTALESTEFTLSPTTPPDPQSSQPSMLKEIFSSAITQALNDDKANASPKLHTSEMLANYINAENELLARQLTMIKSDIGEDNTLVFLEFPHAIDVARGESSERKVQIKWRVKEVCLENPTEEMNELITRLNALGLESESSQTQINNEGEENPQQMLFDFGPEIIAPQEQKNSLSVRSDFILRSSFDLNEIGPINKKNIVKISENVKEQVNYITGETITDSEQSDIILAKLKRAKRLLQKDRSKFISLACKTDDTQSDSVTLTDNVEQTVAWDLIPKADKFNITSQSFESNSFNLSGIFTLITGIGGQASFQKRKEMFQQIAAQQSLSSAYGQGSSEFGWILNPRLGTTTLLQGATTTYASLIAPKNAKVIKLESSYCILSSGEHIGNKQSEGCVESNDYKQHSIVVNEQTGFWVDDVDYGLVKSGDVATVILEGDDFYHNQLSVLIDGVPMRKFSTTHIGGDGVAPTTTVPGSFEVLNSNEVVLKVRKNSNYEGTPEITLVSPKKTRTINYLNVRMGVLGNKFSRMSWLDKMPMFQKEPQITSLQVTEKDTSTVKIRIEGEGFYSNSTVFVNGAPFVADNFARNLEDGTKSPFTLLSTRHIELEAATSDEFRVYINNELAGKNLSAYAATSTVRDKIGELFVTSLEIIRSDDSGSKHKMSLLAHGNNFDNPTVTDITGSTNAINLNKINESLLYFEIETDENSVPVQISQGGKSFLNILSVPKVPKISSVTKSGGSDTFGLTTGGYTIVISGNNFSNVKSVSVDNKLGTIIAKSDTTIEFSPPKSVSAGKKKIVLKTDAQVRGVYVTNASDLNSDNATFEFKAPPPPPKPPKKPKSS